MDDLGINIGGWKKTLTVSYSARDPRDPRYCENELMHVLIARYDGPPHMNRSNVYELRWAGLDEISQGVWADLNKRAISREYAPWIHTMFALPREKVAGALTVK
jgi:isopentenyldiphosphate isomerase